MKVVEQFQTQLRVLDHPIDRRQSISTVKEPIDVGGGQTLVHAAGYGRDAMHPFAEDRHEQLLAPLAQHHHSLDQLGIRLDQSENIALFGCGVDTEQHLRKHEVEVGGDMRLQHLRVMAEPAHLHGSRSQGQP